MKKMGTARVYAGTNAGTAGKNAHATRRG
jgi:hypothetical protein